MRCKPGIAPGSFLAFVGPVGSILEIYNSEGNERADHHDLYMAKFSELARNMVTICGPRFPEADALTD